MADTPNCAGWFLQHEEARRRRTGNSPERTARLLKQQFPEAVARILAEAEQALRGQLTLPGTGSQPAFFGDPPGWYRIVSTTMWST